jgi:hypothetical protein
LQPISLLAPLFDARGGPVVGRSATGTNPADDAAPV